MGTVRDEDRQRRVADLVGELAAVARELVTPCLEADRAAAHWDIDGVCDASDSLLTLQGRYAVLYRELLTMYIREPPAGRSMPT